MNKLYSFCLLAVLTTIPLLSSSQCDYTEVEITTNTVDWGYEVAWELLNEENNILETFQASDDNSTYITLICLEDGCYILHALDSYGDGWNGGSVSIQINDETLEYALQEGPEGYFAFGVNMEGCIIEIPGCTDPNAINYNPLATIDDGSCTTIEGVLEQQSITLLLESGPKDNRINWAIQNRGMDNPNNEFVDEAQFLQMLQDSILPPFTLGASLEKMPYARYRNFFNLYAWWWPDAPSQETGWSWPLLKGMRDAYFLPWADDEHGWATLFSISRTGGGGGAGVQPETRTGDGLMYGVGWETLLHEFGHTMPQVPDEYTASGIWSGGNCWEGANTTAFTIKDSIPWRNWIEEDTPLPTPYEGEYLNTIGAFEGALTNYFGCHRSTARGCYMGAGGFGNGYGQDLCPPCRQRVICYLYRYVDVIENPVPAETNIAIDGPTTMTFSANVIKPEPNTQVYTWLLNGKPITYGEESITVDFSLCDQYELTLTVEDTISWVRYDEHFDHIYPRPFESHTWYIDQLAVSDYDLAATSSTTNVDCTGLPNGSVNWNIEGGQAPYSVFWQNDIISLPHENLQADNYDYQIVDAQGCGIETNAIVESDPKLEVNLCTHFDETWTINSIINAYDSESLTYSWSNGSTSPDLSLVPDGVYTLSVQNSDGCQTIQSINLSAPESPLAVNHRQISSTTTENNGAIYLNIQEGQPPYHIKWYDKPARDLTFPDPDNIGSSGENFDHFPEYAFDNDIYTKWLQLGNSDRWLSFHFPQGEIITYYTITSGDDVPERDPKDWRVEASMNGIDWQVLDTQSNIDFSSRRQKKGFTLNNEETFQYYRFYITANSGADAIQLQELEFIGASSQDEFIYNPHYDDQSVRTGLGLGLYRYLVSDQNNTCIEEAVKLDVFKNFVATNLTVVQENSCSVSIENPQNGYTYFWLADEAATLILGIGPNFQPTSAGNYWVAAVDQLTGTMSDNRTGFAITMPDQPIISEVEEGILGVENPNPDLTYFWYTDDCGSSLIHEGTTYTPGEEAMIYWISAFWNTPFPTPLDPNEVSGLKVRMDASDLDGNGEIDNPAPASSSLYNWQFTPENGWSDGNWFAFRGNQQNGLGIADFATIWLQCLQEGINSYQTIIMAYQENALSWEGSAPFYGLNELIPYSAQPELQLYSAEVPSITTNGITLLNGEQVDPFNTPNSLDFSILAQTFTTPAGWTDCTDTHWEGKIGEILFYENPLETEDLVGISEFLRKKWISTADLESVRTPVAWNGATLNTSDFESGLNIHITPNPVGDHAILFIDGSDKGQIAALDIFNATGARLISTPIEQGQQLLQLDEWLENLSSGMYIIRVRTSTGKSKSLKFVKH